MSIQGVAGGTAVPISGSVSATNPSVGTNNAAVPASSTQVGGTDGTNLQSVHVFDLDSGGGTQFILGVGLRKAASGGSVEAGTSSDPLRVDPTGTTTQPISAASLPLPTGAATSANQTTLGSQTTKLNDGTNTAAVKPASTAAVATDSALVVAISPNNTITTSNASVGTNNAALPASSTEIGGSDGTNLQAIRVFDGDTGGGTQYVLGAILRKSASGGTVEAGTSSDPLRVDPTGTTTQPISAASLPLPTGAATEATLATRLADATFTGRINTLGQKTMANSTPVVIASDQTVIPVSDNAGSLTVDTPQLPAALVGGRLDENVGAWLGSTAPTVGQKTMANSVPVVIASDQTTATVGTHANAWNNVAVGANGVSNSIDCQYTPHITVFGVTSGGSTISFQVSQDNSNFYTSATFNITTGDFGADFTSGARYVRLKSSNARTITATIAGKA
jgi:hypothetical protein